MKCNASYLSASAMAGVGHEQAGAPERVVLLHGILNPRWVMTPLARRLKSEGFTVYVWPYPGSRKKIEDHAASLAVYVKELPGTGVIHFVGFSLGALVIRYMLTHFPLAHVGRFVMIGPPNHGSARGEKLYRGKAFIRWLYGNLAMRQLFPSAIDFYERCGIPPVEFGIIAGDLGPKKWWLPGLSGPHDGTVTVESARLEGAKDFITLNHWHMALLWARDTKESVVHFLKRGSFR